VTRSFWWEIPTLLQCTVLTGWLTLIDADLLFIRLLAALIISNAGLIAVLVCNPYKRKSDFCMAAGVQLLLVCTFIFGIVVHMFEGIVNDVAGSPELAFRITGLRTSEDVAVIMICVAFAMLGFFAATFTADTYMHVVQRRLRMKWSVLTTDPPHVKSWKPRATYACFLSHTRWVSRAHSTKTDWHSAHMHRVDPWENLHIIYTYVRFSRPLRPLLRSDLPFNPLGSQRPLWMRGTCTTCSGGCSKLPSFSTGACL
jgi:hypothetical protein